MIEYPKNITKHQIDIAFKWDVIAILRKTVHNSGWTWTVGAIANIQIFDAPNLAVVITGRVHISSKDLQQI